MDVLMPQLGETVAEGKISKWFVSAGDAVKPGDNLFEIETDKVSMEVPAIAAGTLAAIHVQAGEVAPVGAVVAQIVGAGESAAPPPPPAKAGVQNQELGPAGAGPRAGGGGDERPAAPRPAIPTEPFREVRTPARNYGPGRLPGGTVVTPLARRLAGEAGIDLSNVRGSGPHGRIVAADVESAKNAKPALALAQMTVIATVTLTADVEIGQSLALCEQANAAQKEARLELTDVIVKAWALALARIMPEQADIAVASGNERAVVSDAAGKSLTAIAAARHDGSDAATSSAISIPGVPGIISVADMLLPPQTTLLSLGAPRRAPVETPDGAVRFVSMITATLACDPLTLDASAGAELLSAFKGFVEQPVTMIV